MNVEVLRALRQVWGMERDGPGQSREKSDDIRPLREAVGVHLWSGLGMGSSGDFFFQMNERNTDSVV